MSQSKLEGALLGLHSRHRLTGPSGSAALQREWLDDVGTVIRTQLAKLREMPKPLDRNLRDRVHICMHHNIYIYIYMPEAFLGEAGDCHPEGLRSAASRVAAV